MKFQCPICDNHFDLPESTRVGDRVTCPHCYAQLGIHRHNNQNILTCAFCAEEVFNPLNCDECERRHERRKIFEEGQL